jgi:hypothetical protein
MKILKNFFFKNLTKRTLIFFILFILFKVAFCQHDYGDSGDWEDDDENLTLAEVGSSLLIGGSFAIVGFLIMQIKVMNSLGKILLGIGAFVGGIAVVLYLLQIIAIILSAAFNLALKLAIIVGVILLAVWIIKGIYDWISGNTKY